MEMEADAETAVFPGGFLPSVAYTSEMISKGSNNRLTIDSIVNIGVSDPAKPHPVIVAGLTLLLSATLRPHPPRMANPIP